MLDRYRNRHNSAQLRTLGECPPSPPAAATRSLLLESRRAANRMPLPPKPPALDVLGWAAPSTSSTSEPTIPGAIVLSSDSAFWELHEEVRTLGKGSFGEVRLVRIRSTGALVAVKIIAKSGAPADECYGAVDARNEPTILMEVQRKFDSAPARIGGRRRQRLGMTPQPSLLQLQDALRAPAVDAAMPLPLSPAAGLTHHPRHRRTVSLGKDMDVAAATRPQTLPYRRNAQKGKARPSAMSLWELQEALGEQGASGSCQEDAMDTMASTAEPEATQQQHHQQQQLQQQQQQQLQQQGVVSVGEDGDGDGGEGGGAPEEGEEGEGEGEDDSVRLLEVYDSPATLFMVMRAELGGDLESRSLSPQPSQPYSALLNPPLSPPQPSSALLSPPQPSPSSLALGPRPKPSPLPHPQPAAPTLTSGSPRYRAACVPRTRRACTRRPSYERSSRCKPKAIRTRRLAPLAPALTLTIHPHLPTTRPPSPGTPRGWYTATSSRVTCCSTSSKRAGWATSDSP